MPEEEVSQEPGANDAVDPNGSGQENPDAFAAEMGMLTEGPDVASPADGGVPSESVPNAPTDTPAFDPATFSSSRTRIENVPEQYRPIVQRAQEEFRGLQATLNERTEQNQTLQQANTELNGRMSSLEQQRAEPAAEEATGANPYPYLQLNPNISAESRQAAYEGAHQVEQIFQHHLAPYMEYLNAMPTIVQAVNQMYQQGQQVKTSAVENEFNEARDFYGERVDEHRETIDGMRGLNNPATGKPFTVTEAYERLFGVTAGESEKIKSDRAAARQYAKKSGSRPPAPSGTTTPAKVGNSSISEGIDTMRRAGFD